MLAHASSHFQTTPRHGHLVHTVLAVFAYFGVTVFFVISGFLITTLLLKEHARTSRVDLKKFYRRRAVRILPACLFYIAIILVFGNATKIQAIYALTFTTSFFYDHAYIGLQQLWSLSVEEQFYLLWPLFFLRNIRNAKWGGWLVMIFCPIIRIVLSHYGYTQYSHLAPAIDDSLAAGCLLSLYREQVRAFTLRYLVSIRSFIFLWIITIGTAEVLYAKGVVVLWGVVPCLIALTISASIERKDKIFNQGPLVWSGLLSYSLYLWQQPFFVFGGPLNYLSVRLLLTFVAAYISYQLIEQPVLKYFSKDASSRAGISITAPTIS